MKIHPRPDWTAREPIGTTPLVETAVRYIVIHWPGSVGSLAAKSVAALLRGWQGYHMNDRGWRDIAYNEAVDLVGDVWELRGNNADGSVGNMGGKVYSILAVLGDADKPTAEMLATISRRIAEARKRYPHARLVGHCDLKATDCPGRDLHTWLKRGAPVPKPGSPQPFKTAAPQFPLPVGYYFGPRLPATNTRSVSGYYNRRFSGKTDWAWLKQWQTKAKALGAYTGKIDGLYGPLTAAAAVAVQRRAKLVVDGLIGAKTWLVTWMQ